MKRIITLIMISLMILSLAACKKAEPKPIANVTEAPTVTEAPEATEAPAEQHDFKTGGVDFCEALEVGNTYYYDLDGDGLCDSIFAYDVTNGEFGYPVTSIKVIRGAYPDDTYTVDNSIEGGVQFWVIDSDPADGRLEIIEHIDATDPGGGSSNFYIPGTQDSGFECIHCPEMFISESDRFSSEDGFRVYLATEVFGSSDLISRMRIEGDKVVLTDHCRYLNCASLTGFPAMMLKMDMEVTLINEDGSLGEKEILPAGTAFVPLFADNYGNEITWVEIELQDGRYAKVFGEYDKDGRDPERMCYPWFIGGVIQDDYVDLAYGG